MGRLHCVIHIPDGEPIDRWLAECTLRAAREGWDVQSITRDWAELCRVLGTGLAHVGITPSAGLLHPRRLPRLVTLDDPPPPDRGRPHIRW